MTHQRLSVHNVTFYGAPLTDLQKHWTDLAVYPVEHPGQPAARSGNSQTCCSTTTTASRPCTTCSPVARWPTTRRTPATALNRVIDAAAAVGARTVYLLTGGRGALTWAQAAERFCEMIAPCAAHAERSGVALAIENASSLYADLHLAHTLRDTITLAEMSGLDICIDVFHCWAEGDVDGAACSARCRAPG